MRQGNDYSTIHPGRVLKEELDKRELKQKDFASTIGMPASVLNDIIKEKRSVTPDIAILLEAALDKDAAFWLSLQSARDIEIAKKKEEFLRKQQDIDTWKAIQDYCNVRYLERFIKNGLGKNTKEKIDCIFRFFKVKNIEELRYCFLTNIDPAFFRKSETLSNDPVCLFTWKYMAFNASESINSAIGRFNKSDLNSLTDALKPIFYENRDTKERLEILLAQYGIRLVYLPNEKGTHVDGFSFWRGSNPTITLTLRGKKLDILAFTLLHEVYHVYNHLDKSNQDKTCISIDGEKTSLEEQDADSFANSQLIPPIEWQLFKAKTEHLSPYSMGPFFRAFSEAYKIHPSIILGRYQHDYKVFDNGRGIERSIN